MPPETSNPASAAPRTGSGASNCSDAFDAPINKPPTSVLQAPRVAAAVADLMLDSAIEAGCIASATARHFVEQVEMGDFWGAEHSLKLTIAHMQIAADSFQKLKGARNGR
jgi:hypothetical protein